MTTSTKKLFDLTQLAEASYADLIMGNDLERELKNSSFGMSFSATQATEFATHWSVASHQANTGSGFSATLFEDKTASGNYTLAIRGTEIPSGIFSDLLSADVNGITLTGAARVGRTRLQCAA
jgi:hypothetical protein